MKKDDKSDEALGLQPFVVAKDQEAFEGDHGAAEDGRQAGHGGQEGDQRAHVGVEEGLFVDAVQFARYLKRRNDAADEEVDEGQADDAVVP